MLSLRLWQWPIFSVALNTTRQPNTGLMLIQRCRWLANINPTLVQRLVLDSLHDRKRWTEINGTQIHRQHWKDRCKPTCPHLCVQRGDIIKKVLQHCNIVSLCLTAWMETFKRFRVFNATMLKHSRAFEFKRSEFIIVIFIHYKPRIAVAILHF